MTTKADITRLSDELEEVYQQIEAIASENPSVIVYKDDKFAESFSSFVETFRKKLDFFKRELNKYGDQIKEQNKKAKRAKQHESSRKANKMSKP